ncbi:MAG: PilW family protein [Myxococcota bacterium]
MKVARGFTLTELLVGLAVTSITLVTLATAVIGVQASYQNEYEVSETLEKSRDAMLFIERATQLIGYGVDPRLAIDLGVPPGATARDNVTVGGFTYPAPVTPAPLVVTDDFAFRYRDPAFLRRGTFDGSTVALTSGTFDDLPVGKLLMIACVGAQDVAVARVAAAPSGASVSVDTSNIAPFVNSANGCLTATGAQAPYVMLVHEYRLRIANLGNRPWLVAYRNLSDNVTTSTNFDPIAPDIEAFQVAFGMNRPLPTSACCAATAAPDATGNANWVVGDAVGETVFGPPANPATSAPGYADGYDTTARFQALPANIRSVSLTLVARSRRPEPSKRKLDGQVDLLNWDSTGSGQPDGFYRTMLHTVIETPNLASRSFFVPTLRTASGTDVNTWGG